MVITDAQLRTIHSNAATLVERHGEALLKGNVFEELTLQQTRAWDHAVSGKGSHLKSRIALFKMQPKQIKSAVDGYRYQGTKPEGWIAGFRTILQIYPSDLDKTIAFNLQSQKPAPFRELLLPFIEYAVGTLQKTIDIPPVVTTEALKTHLHFLLKKLSRLSSGCFYVYFDAYRKSQRKNINVAPSGNKLYQKFIQRLFSGDIILFFEEYSALARLLTITTEHWIKSATLLYARLSKDASVIHEEFFDNRSPGPLVEIKAGLTAVHTDEGEVCALRFASGKTLIYKPRSAATDVALQHILKWCSKHEKLMPMQAVSVVDKQTYSWHAYIPGASCSNEEEVGGYYQRIGQLAALLQILGSTDYHFDNIRADGQHPVLIDNETLFSPFVRVDEDFTITGDPHLDEGVVHSLARSLFLIDSRQLLYPGTSSIAGVFNDTDRHRVVRYLHMNTDAMFEKISYRSRTGMSIARLHHRKVNPHTYVSRILSGYQNFLRSTQHNMNGFTTVVSTATDNFNLDVRLLIRPTASYEEIMGRSLRPQYLRDGVSRSFLFEELASFYLKSNAATEVSSLLWTEISMLEQYQVPWFHLNSGNRSYTGAQLRQQEKSVIRLSAKEVFEENLRLLGTSFIRKHIALIEHYHKPPFKAQQKLKSDRMLSDILSTAHNLRLCYSELYPWEATMESAQRGEPEVLKRYTLGDGFCGPILLFAALRNITGDNAFVSVTRQMMNPLIQYLQNCETNTRQQEIGYGAMEGLGSIIYALSVVSEFLQDSKYRRLAQRLVSIASIDDILKTRDHSLSHGIAGYLVGLIKLDQLPDKKSHQNLSTLIQQLTRTLQDGLTLQNPEVQDAGYMHGASGILFALCKSYYRHPEPSVLESMRQLYVQLSENWNGTTAGLEFKKDRGWKSFDNGLAGWCLVQDAVRKIPGIPVDEKQLNRHIRLLLRSRKYDTDQIATGLAGHCEPALLSRYVMKTEVHDFVSAWMEKYADTRRHNLTPRYMDTFFYHGTSGILFQQLRILHPDTIPSVLTYA